MQTREHILDAAQILVALEEGVVSRQDDREIEVAAPGVRSVGPGSEYDRLVYVLFAKSRMFAVRPPRIPS
jgi:hypothetical protein